MTAAIDTVSPPQSATPSLQWQPATWDDYLAYRDQDPLAMNLDQKKKLYAAMGIPEYWVVNIPGKQVFVFHLEKGAYQQREHSLALPGLPITLLETTLEQLEEGTNGSAALWFAQQIESLQEPS